MSYINTYSENHILFIQIQRAEKYNALSPCMYDDLGAALYQLDNDDDLRVAVVYADGKHFTAGVELDLWKDRFGSGNAFPLKPNTVDPLGLSGTQRKKPVIMAVQGYCFTWGVEMLLNTDIRVAARDTQFQMLEVQRGLHPCGGATLRLPKQIGWGNAQKVLLTGDRWDAETAERWGMVQALCEPGEQLAVATELATKVTKAAPLGVQGCLKACHYGETHPHDDAVEQLMQGMIPIMASEDAAEGVLSFIERREAVFKGK